MALIGHNEKKQKKGEPVRDDASVLQLQKLIQSLQKIVKILIACTKYESTRLNTAMLTIKS